MNLDNFDIYQKEIINIGWGQDISIKELAELIADIANYNGNLLFDSNMPDGTPRKILDVTKISNLGWKPSINLKQGLSQTINEVNSFLNNL